MVSLSSKATVKLLFASGLCNTQIFACGDYWSLATKVMMVMEDSGVQTQQYLVCHAQGAQWQKGVVCQLLCTKTVPQRIDDTLTLNSRKFV